MIKFNLHCPLISIQKLWLSSPYHRQTLCQIWTPLVKNERGICVTSYQVDVKHFELDYNSNVILNARDQCCHLYTLKQSIYQIWISSVKKWHQKCHITILDLGVKGRGQIYSFTSRNANSFDFFVESVHIKHTACFWCVDQTTNMALGSKSMSNILKLVYGSYCQLLFQFLTIEWWLYLAKLLRMVCRS